MLKRNSIVHFVIYVHDQNDTVSIHKSIISDCNTDLDLVFVIDSSTSVGLKNFKAALHFVKEVVSPLEFASGKTRVGLVTFNNQAFVRFYLDTFSSREEVISVSYNLLHTTHFPLDEIAGDIFQWIFSSVITCWFRFFIWIISLGCDLW